MEFSKKLHRLIFEDFKGLNLTNYSNFDDFNMLQIYDSLKPLEECPIFTKLIEEQKIVLDVGFGGGFPLLPLAHKLPHIQFIGIEAKRKKVDAVNIIKDRLELKNVKLIHERIENIIIDKDIVVVVKAVSEITLFLNKIKTNNKIFIFFYKGPLVEDKEDIKSVRFFWEEIENIKYSLGEFQRTILGFSNKNVPHGTFSFQKDKALSEIIK